MLATESTIPVIEYYMSDFGNIVARGLGAVLKNHLKTKRWKWAYDDGWDIYSTRRHKEYLCSRKCQTCKIEMTLNQLASQIFVTGGMLKSIEIEPPGPDDKHQDMKPLKKGRGKAPFDY